MSAELAFIQAFPEVDESRIRMKWNGSRGLTFEDANQYFRERVILKIMNKEAGADTDLLKLLFEEEVAWTVKSLTYRYYLPYLIDELIEEGEWDFIAEILYHNEYAYKALIDITVSDEVLNRDMLRLGGSRNPEKVRLVKELDEVMVQREEKIAQKEAFEAYVKERDKPHVAAKKSLKTLWKEGTPEFLALFFVIPFALALGYYWFGRSIFVGLIPMGLALAVIWIMYKMVTRVGRKKTKW